MKPLFLHITQNQKSHVSNIVMFCVKDRRLFLKDGHLLKIDGPLFISLRLTCNGFNHATKKRSHFYCNSFFIRRDTRIRTWDPLLPKQVR